MAAIIDTSIIDTSPRARRLLPCAVVAALALLFLANASTWLGSGFGESHDGRNAAIWGMSSRALREAPIESRLGGELSPGYTYANHPPMIIFETAAAEAIAGEHRIVTRAPAWLASLVALAMVCLLLLDVGLSATAVAAGVAATFGSAMFFVHGTMLDTPVTSFPVTVALVWAAHRALTSRAIAPWAMGALGAFAALSGWQAVVVCGAVCVALLVRIAVDGRRAGPPGELATSERRALLVRIAALAFGTATGLALTFSWIHWVYGSFGPLRENGGYRAAGSSLLASAEVQWSHLWSLMPLALVLAVACAPFALRHRRARPLFVISLGAIAAYALAFRGAAEMHDYWNYAVLLPAAIAVAAGAQALLDRATTIGATNLPVALSLGAVALLAVGVTRPSVAQLRTENALATVRLAAIADDRSPKDGPALAYISSSGSLSRWIDYETGRPGLVLVDDVSLRALVVNSPELPVLVVLPLLDARGQEIVHGAAIAVDGPYALVTAAVALDARSSA